MSLEDYEILSRLGSGAYSTVHKVRCKLSGSFFAMKEIKFDNLSAKEKDYTRTEVKILKTIQHPNIIRFEKSFSVGSNFYIIMELATCGDLQEKISKYAENQMNFPVDKIWHYTYQIILGLQALHENNILHRDIKASNIFIMDNDILKIGDFNIGKEGVETLKCTKIGTPLMMSPEVWNGEAYNFKTDIWSLGCLVYQMAALRTPFVAENYAALYLKINKMKYPKLSNYPKSLGNFIEKLLKKKPKLRPSCSEMLKMDEFKKFKNDESDEKVVKSNRRESRVKVIHCKPKNLISSLSKDASSVRKSRNELSPLGKLALKSLGRDQKMPISNNSRCQYLISKHSSKCNLQNCSKKPSPHSPKPNVSSHRNLSSHGLLFNDPPISILDSYDIPGSFFKQNSYNYLPGPSTKFIRNSCKDPDDSPAIKSYNVSEISINNLERSENKLKSLNAPRFFKSSAAKNIQDSVHITYKKKNSMASFNIGQIASTPNNYSKIPNKHFF
ncbi:hypothetical protein SteCoe_6319 [Stentor coeruleus]|uniref:non-specific serine/threonine protein kinase n=1 Tax=Stentor coeruleus TaxID=5963 RepID=A0A1R2CQ74_9CILI|nr:hypothetical protein SteCoe_6319 [Stentor coeruleus]